MAVTPEELRIRISAQNDASRPISQVRKDLAWLGTGAAQTQKAVMGTTKSIDGFGRKAGMAGIQIQQFVGQVQGGTSAFVALSQQAADLGFVLGFPLLGAVTGIAAAFAGPLISAFMGAEENADSLRKQIEGLDKAFKELTKSQQTAYIASVQTEINSLESSSSDLRQEIYDLKDGWSLMGKEAKSAKINELTAQIDTNDQMIVKLKKDLLDYVNGADESSDANDRLSTSFETLDDQLRQLDALYIKFETPSERLVRRYKKADAVLAKFAGTEDLHKRMLASALEEYKKTIPEQERATQKTTELAGETENLNWAYQDVADRGIKSMEDGLIGLVNGTQSAKDAFRSMASSIINDLIRMQIQQSITSNIGGFLSGLFGGGVSTPASSGLAVGNAATPLAGMNIGSPVKKALGGAVTAGQAYTVGEHGRETFVPNTNGAIVPNDAMGGGVTINQTINVSTGVSQTVRAEIVQMLPQITEASKSAVLAAKRQGGSFAKAFGA